MEILVSLVAGLVSVSLAGIVSSSTVGKIIESIGIEPANVEASYSDRLSKLSKKLEDASTDVDAVLGEIAQVARDRQTAVETLESNLKGLEVKEASLKERVAALENTPVEAAKHFAELIAAGEKRGARRDYILFGSGVLVSTAVAIALQLVFGS